MRWWIESPGKIRRLTASPSTFTPNGDGVRDRTVVSWRTRQPGFMNAKIRNRSGRVVERRYFGRLREGAHAIRWNGRNTDGDRVRAGRYRITLYWANGLGRVDSATTRVTVYR
jgi:flagellar hook assembly protein FlgD